MNSIHSDSVYSGIAEIPELYMSTILIMNRYTCHKLERVKLVEPEL
jgi:hypothetical protein